jgi:hypothetical protein
LEPGVVPSFEEHLSKLSFRKKGRQTELNPCI